METTLTLSQNNALYFAHAYCGETRRQRAAFFRRFVAGIPVQPPAVRRERTLRRECASAKLRESH